MMARLKKTTLGLLLLLSIHAKAEEAVSPTILKVIDREIEVNGKKAKVYGIEQTDGTLGLVLKKGQEFNVSVENQIHEPTSIHWHGLILPNDQDGVAYITQLPIRPGEKYPYQFPIVQSGTYWMHSHFGLQGQKLMTAPLILLDPITFPKAQEVVVFLNDFSFKEPSFIFNDLRKNYESPMPIDMKMEKTGKDLVDVAYDAFLVNLATLSKPQVISVNPGSLVRLRIINGSSSTNFYVKLQELEAQAIAFDGQPIYPLKSKQFELGIANRLDLLVRLPNTEGAYPILVQGEGTTMLGGLVLATPKASHPSLSEKTGEPAEAFTGKQQLKMRALKSLEKKKVDKVLQVKLGGDMFRYIWTINGKAWPDTTPLEVKKGERVEIVFENATTMSHPMHLHGHTFQITEINGIGLEGTKCDTVLVLPKGIVKIQFDADNPGIWPLHCHNLYHQAAGMFTTLNYVGYPIPNFTTYEKRFVTTSEETFR